VKEIQPQELKDFTDLEVAKKYLTKSNNARRRGIDFKLSFSEYRSLLRKKKCGLTGLKFTWEDGGKDHKWPTQRTIDRIDNTKGYTKGNVMVVCHCVNQFKASWEDPDSPLTLDLVNIIVKNTEILIKKDS